VAASYRLIVRRRGKTEKSGFPTLDAALDALETELRAASTEAARAPRVQRALGREYGPVAQVVVRGELRGPQGLRAGIDVRGDGSAEAFTGRVRRRPAPVREREDAWGALRRMVREATG
jgi:hypothetical protein